MTSYEVSLANYLAYSCQQLVAKVAKLDPNQTSCDHSKKYFFAEKHKKDKFLLTLCFLRNKIGFDWMKFSSWESSSTGMFPLTWFEFLLTNIELKSSSASSSQKMIFPVLFDFFKERNFHLGSCFFIFSEARHQSELKLISKNLNEFDRNRNKTLVRTFLFQRRF